MMDRLLSSLVTIGSKIVHLAITLELPLIPHLRIRDILSDTTWAALNRAISRFLTMTHFTLECKLFSVPETDEDHATSRVMSSSGVATMLQLLPCLISKHILSGVLYSRKLNFSRPIDIPPDDIIFLITYPVLNIPEL